MTRLSDLFDPKELQHCLDERLVVARKHPSAPLTILNYTERCQYERDNWNAVTLACRGLIHDDSGQIIARPFRKFFNHGQSEGGQFDPTAPVIVTDKMDGSLGILYPNHGEYAIATRGAFESEQAQHATALWGERYGHLHPSPYWTFLFEILYPSNRIVLDYGDRDDLVLLGAVEIATGGSVGPGSASLILGWQGPRAETFAFATLADALNAPPRPNAEGLVVHFINTDDRLKIKQEDYVALHKIVTGLNERTVWEHLLDGKPIDEILAVFPDEFHEWVRGVAARLEASVGTDAAEVERAYSAILTALPDGFTRKDFAMRATQHDDPGSLFKRHDGKEYHKQLWMKHKPEPRLGPRGLAPSEATA